MYINFWYPVILGEELKDEPVKVRMLGQNFVVFRDSEGNPNTLHDICIHRGASLSEGLIKKDCIQCHTTGGNLMGRANARRFLL